MWSINDRLFQETEHTFGEFAGGFQDFLLMYIFFSSNSSINDSFSNYPSLMDHTV